MKRRIHASQMFFGLFFWLSLVALLVWSPAACRPSAPNGDDKATGEDKAGTPDSGNPNPDTNNPNPDKNDPPGDRSTPPKELTIMDIQNPSAPNHVIKGAAVVLKGVVVMSPVFTVSTTSGLQGFFVADPAFPAKQWGGVLVVVDKEFSTALAIGDKVDIEGAVDEFSDNTQVVARATRGGNVTKTGNIPVADIKPVVVTPADIPGERDATTPDNSKAEPYESVFVELKDVEVEQAPDQYGVWKLKGGVVVDDEFFRGFKPKVGDKLAFVRGILYYAFDLYRLSPRFSADIDGAKPACTKTEDCGTGQKCESENCVAIRCTKNEDCKTGEQCNANSYCELPQKTVTVEDVQNPASPNFVPPNNPVEIKGVIATSNMYDVSANLKGFFVSDPTFPTKPFGGVMVVVSKAWPDTIAIGDEVNIVGRTSEFYDNTQISIDTSKDGKLEKTGNSMKDKVVARAVTLAEIPSAPADKTKPNDSPSEAFEGMLVEFKDVTVQEEADKNGEWKIDGGFVVDDVLFKSTPTKGDKLSVLRGIIQFNFGTYRLLPRSAEDLQKAP